jgi:hypothetical protein
MKEPQGRKPPGDMDIWRHVGTTLCRAQKHRGAQGRRLHPTHTGLEQRRFHLHKGQRAKNKIWDNTKSLGFTSMALIPLAARSR